MADRQSQTQNYEALRVERTGDIGSGPQPRDAQLAWRVGDAITQIMLHQGVVDSRDQPITPVRAALRSRHDPEAPNAFTIPSLHLQHPLRRPRTAREFWLFDQGRLEDAHFRSPGDLAFPIAVALRDVFAGTPYWNGQLSLLRSGSPNSPGSGRISLPNFVLAMDEAPNGREGPLSTRDIVGHATDISNMAVNLVTGARRLGRVMFSSESYRYVPRSHALVPQEGAMGADQIAIVPSR